MTFQRGDVVLYMSGGQKLTVTQSNVEKTTCEFMRPGGSLGTSEFRTDLLMLLESSFVPPPVQVDEG